MKIIPCVSFVFLAIIAWENQKKSTHRCITAAVVILFACCVDILSEYWSVSLTISSERISSLISTKRFILLGEQPTEEMHLRE
jgi:uncharacterized protein YqgC (DUF456 family)